MLVHQSSERRTIPSRKSMSTSTQRLFSVHLVLPIAHTQITSQLALLCCLLISFIHKVRLAPPTVDLWERAYTMMATAMKTWKSNGVLLRNGQIHDIIEQISQNSVSVMVCDCHCWWPLWSFFTEKSRLILSSKEGVRWRRNVSF